MKKEIEQLLSTAITALYGEKLEVVLTSPPDVSMGDFATNIAFQLAKVAKKAPQAIAESIIDQIKTHPLIKDVHVVSPGFINIFINKDAFILDALKYFQSSEYSFTYIVDKKVSVEHTAANPNKHLHIGHLRNFSIADTLVRVLKAVGYAVKVQYFNNDQGLQVAKVVWGFRHLETLGLQSLDINVTEHFDTVAAQVYVAAEKAFVEHPEYEEEVRLIIHEMEEGNNETALYSEELTHKILTGQLQTVQAFGVYYDELITESSLTQSGELQRVIAILLKMGKAVQETEGKNKGCVVMKDDSGVLADKVLLRADGTAVYTAKDIVLHLWKYGLLDVTLYFKVFEVQPNGVPVYISTADKGNAIPLQETAFFHVNVVDQRQSYPLQVVKESLSALGYAAESQSFHHLAYETVILSVQSAKELGFDVPSDAKWVAMSGRKGVEVSINTLLRMLSEKILARNAEKQQTISYKEAQDIAASALRYYMIKYAYNTVIIFDIQEALRSDGDSGIYLLYAYVRAQKILQKTGKHFFDVVQVPATIDETAYALLTHLQYAQDVVRSASEDFSINQIAVYTYELARLFTTFYQNVPVLQSEDPTKTFYLGLISGFVNVYGNLLDLLGMARPESM